MQSLQSSRMDRPDAKLIREEFQNAADMLLHACKKGRWKLGENVNPLQLAHELEQIIKNHQACWLARNRPGGLEDSVRRLTDNFQEYRKQARIQAEK
jgi:hypothetical protein